MTLSLEFFCKRNNINQSQEAIAAWLVAKFPGLKSSSPKNHFDLAEEIIKGEAEIMADGIRRIRIIELDVRTKHKPEQRIYEEKQVYNDGKIRERRHKNGKLYLPSEKILHSEPASEALKRAMQEELGISKFETRRKNIKVEKSSVSAYQGIDSLVEVFQYEVWIPNPEDSYSEVQSKKTTYFTWGVINES